MFIVQSILNFFHTPESDRKQANEKRISVSFIRVSNDKYERRWNDLLQFHLWNSNIFLMQIKII